MRIMGYNEDSASEIITFYAAKCGQKALQAQRSSVESLSSRSRGTEAAALCSYVLHHVADAPRQHRGHRRTSCRNAHSGGSVDTLTLSSLDSALPILIPDLIARRSTGDWQKPARYTALREKYSRVYRWGIRVYFAEVNFTHHEWIFEHSSRSVRKICVAISSQISINVTNARLSTRHSRRHGFAR